jgi:hypothetical protein
MPAPNAGTIVAHPIFNAVMPRRNHMPAPNAGTIVAGPVFKAVSHVGPQWTANVASKVGPPQNVILDLSNVILSLSKDAHQHNRETASCRT